jgi:hypothetical protein
MEVTMPKAAFATHMRVASFAGIVALAAASVQGAIAQPLAMVAVLGVLGAFAAAGFSAGISRKPDPIRVKAETRVPPSRRHR